jgi:hypothetical protein
MTNFTLTFPDAKLNGHAPVLIAFYGSAPLGKLWQVRLNTADLDAAVMADGNITLKFASPVNPVMFESYVVWRENPPTWIKLHVSMVAVDVVIPSLDLPEDSDKFFEELFSS